MQKSNKLENIKWIKIFLIFILCLAISGCTVQDKTKSLGQLSDRVEQMTYTFETGETVSFIFKTVGNKCIYCLENGTELLSYNSNSTLSLRDFHDVVFDNLNAKARKNIIDFYEEQAFPLRIHDYLLRAYVDFKNQEEGSEFRCYDLDWSTVPYSANHRLVYVLTEAFLPVNQNEYCQIRETHAFERDSGYVIDGWDLFSAPEDEVKTVLFQASGLGESERESFFSLFNPKNICFYKEGYEITISSVSAPIESKSAAIEDMNYSFGGCYSKELCAILEPWAIPDAAIE